MREFDRGAPSRRSPGVVLVADPDGEARLRAHMRLQEHGLEVLEAATWTQARRLIEERRVAAVVLGDALVPQGPEVAIPTLRRAQAGVRIVYWTADPLRIPPELAGEVWVLPRDGRARDFVAAVLGPTPEGELHTDPRFRERAARAGARQGTDRAEAREGEDRGAEGASTRKKA